MPSKKNKSRAAQMQPQPAQSDYDTDTATVTDAAPSMATPPARTNTELNMLVLRRYVPEIERIISIAPFAVVYLFSPEIQQWEKSGVEGTLFVCQLSAAETGNTKYNVTILNRKGLDNFITDLVSGEDIEITEQYVILQVLGEDSTPNIYGLWIFSDDGSVPSTKDVVANAIQECAIKAERGRTSESQNGHTAVPAYNLDGVMDEVMEEDQTPIQANGGGRQIDLLSLFNKPTPEPAPEPVEHAAAQPIAQQSFPQPNRFTSTADTDFFRTSDSPAAPMQQRPQPPPQQNTLLDLFKSVKKG